MGLSGTLSSSVGALQVFQQALEVTQNNVNNASTPGFAKQRLAIESLPFDPERGLPGGVRSEGPESYRDHYAEQAVWRRQEDYGSHDQLAACLNLVEPYFDVTGGAGIPGALNRFFQSVLAWSVAPNDATSRAAVVEQASYLAERVRDTARGLVAVQTTAEHQIQETTDAINRLAEMLSELNRQIRQDTRTADDPSVDARLHTVLEELAENVNITSLRQADGTWTILLGGQTPLVVGDRHYEIMAGHSGTQMIIVDAAGREVTSQVSRGRLGALLEFRNTTLPSYASTLDRLASTLADRVNAVLAAGVDMNNQPGAALFAYDPAAGAAVSLRVTSITPEELAGALPSAPGGNGNVFNLAALANSGEIDGASFTDYYAALARRVGQALQTAREDQRTSQQLLFQAQALRKEASGVSLDEEAVHLIEFQRAYQATARLITVLSELTEEAINLLR